MAMDRIIKANIDRFTMLLLTEAEPTKRAMIVRLLGEEHSKRDERAKTLASRRAALPGA